MDFLTYMPIRVKSSESRCFFACIRKRNLHIKDGVYGSRFHKTISISISIPAATLENIKHAEKTS